jgi:hypothetical protein
MEKVKNLKGGYIGLIMLLIGVAVIVFLIVRTDLFSGQKGSKNMIEQGTDSIQKAEDVKNIIEQNNTKTMEEL